MARTTHRVAEALLAYAEAILDSPQRAQTLAVLDETRRVMDSGRRLHFGDAEAGCSPCMRWPTATRRSGTCGYADEAVAFFRKHFPDTWKVPLALQVAARARSCSASSRRPRRSTARRLPRCKRRDAGPSAYAIVPLVGIAGAQLGARRRSEAERHYREALALWLERNGPNHGETLQSEVKLGAYLHATSRRAEGRRLMESAAAKVAPDAAPQPPGYVVAVVSDPRYSCSPRASGGGRPIIALDLADARQHYPDSPPLATALRFQGASPYGAGP